MVIWAKGLPLEKGKQPIHTSFIVVILGQEREKKKDN